MSWSDLAKLPQRAAVDLLGTEPFTFEPAGGTPISVTPAGEPLLGIFRGAHVALDLATGAQVSSNEPMLDVILSDLPSIPLALKDAVVIRGRRWEIRDVQKDGEGMASLLLTGSKRLD